MTLSLVAVTDWFICTTCCCRLFANGSTSAASINVGERLDTLQVVYVNTPVGVAAEGSSSEVLAVDSMSHRLIDSSGALSIEANLTVLIKRAISVRTVSLLAVENTPSRLPVQATDHAGSTPTTLLCLLVVQAPVYGQLFEETARGDMRAVTSGHMLEQQQARAESTFSSLVYTGRPLFFSAPRTTYRGAYIPNQNNDSMVVQACRCNNSWVKSIPVTLPIIVRNTNQPAVLSYQSDTRVSVYPTGSTGAK